MRRLTLRQLRIFEAVARHLSFSRAAAELHLSQPAVSIQVKGIETILGLPLTEQLGKKIFLTDAGREVLSASQSITSRLDDLQSDLAQLRGLRTGELKLAVTSTAAHIATDLLARFRQHLPKVKLHLDVANRTAVLSRLAANQVDLAIMGQVPDRPELQATRFMDNPLGVIAAPDHPLAGQAHIPLSALSEESFLVREPESGTRAAVERFFAEHGMRLKTGMEMNSNGAIRRAASIGLGLGILPLQTLELELSLQRLVVLSVEDFPLMRHWYVVNRLDKRLSPAARAFREFVLECAESEDAPPPRLEE